MHSHETHINYHKFFHSRMNGIYLFHSTLFFVKSLIGIFVPVYLFSMGFTISQILVYSLLISIVIIISIPLATKIINKLGFKYTLLVTVPIYIIHITTINFIESNIIFFHLAWLTFGSYVSLFWLSYHAEIGANGINKNRGRQVGNLQILTIFVTALAPLIGGLFLHYLNYFILLFISTVILSISLIPLLISKDIKIKKHNYSYKSYLQINKRINKQDKISFRAEGINHELGLIIWPIFFFILIGSNFLILGTTLTIISVITIIVILILKNNLDSSNKNKLLKTSTRFLAASWGLKSIVILLSNIFLYIIEVISRIIQTAFNTTYFSIFYNNAKRKGYLNYIISRELNLNISKIVFSSICIIILNLFGENLFSLSFLVSFGMISSIYLSKIKEIF